MGALWGEIEVQKSTRSIISSSTQYFNEIWPQASSWVPNAGVLSLSKIAARLGVIVHGVKLGCKRYTGYWSSYLYTGLE